jgi:protein-arginine kinase activator protein McsA
MLGPKCETCGQPATVHETEIAAGKATTRHLCEAHGAPSLPPVDPEVQAALLRDAEEYLRGLSDAEREELARAYRYPRRRI